MSRSIGGNLSALGRSFHDIKTNINSECREPFHDTKNIARLSGSQLEKKNKKVACHDPGTNEAKLLNIFKNEGKLHKNHKRKFWMKRFDDEVIRNQKMFWTKLKYIHNNPIKAGLVNRLEDYKYSSARNYILGDHSVITVDTEYAGIEFN